MKPILFFSVCSVFAGGCAIYGSPTEDADSLGEALLQEASAMAIPPEPCDVSVPADYDTVQEGIDATPDEGTLCIAAGTYTENLFLEDRTIRVVGRGPTRTFLDGGGLDTTVQVVSSNLELVGVTVRGGYSHGTEYGYNNGGGIRATSGYGGSYVYLQDVTVSDNEATGGGGAMSAMQSNIELERVRVLRNRAGYGGGAYFGEGGITGHDVDFIGNEATISGGGAIAGGRGGVSLYNSAILGNRASGAYGDGGGLSIGNAGGELVNTVVAGNTATRYGGGVAIGGYYGYDIMNAVFAGNRAAMGGALYVSGDGNTVNVTNTVIANNRATTEGGGVMIGEGYASVPMEYCDLWRNVGGNIVGAPSPVGTNGNISVNPAFVAYSPATRPTSWDFHLQAGSPLINAGDPELTDPDGTRSDIGAYGGPGAE